jgi:Family of unknown function (DUF6445)
VQESPLNLTFNPNPSIREVFFFNGQSCFIIDDALTQPEKWVQFSSDRKDLFQAPAVYAYPGVELPAPQEIASRLDDFFQLHIRHRLGARRTLESNSRFSLMTLQPAELKPWQCICHRDRFISEPDMSIAASVLYLFSEPSFGGTNFYLPKKDAHEINVLRQDAGALSSEAFAEKYGLPQDYMTTSNDYFELIGEIPAKWNRIIFYDGSVFHSSAFSRPEKYTANPLSGRLTLNGFFTCRKKLREPNGL